MSFKVVVFVAAVFAYEANAQLGGLVRPFATGFANGFGEIAKPVGHFGQAVMSPINDYVSGIPQMVSYPGRYVPKPQTFDRFDSFAPGMPGASYFQGMRPAAGNLRPQNQYFSVQSQYFRPSRPYPVSSVVGEANKYRPSNLLIQPPAEIPKPEGPATLDAQFEDPKPENPATLDAGFEGPKPEVPATLDAEFDVPTMQRPLPIEEDQQ